MPETCDTSVLVSAMLPWHDHHARAYEAVQGISAYPAHVFVECYSVLTRLPAPYRLSPAAAFTLLDRVPGSILTLPADRHVAALRHLSALGIKGGATYDGVVAATAAAHDRMLVTLDRRALAAYDAVGARFRML